MHRDTLSSALKSKFRILEQSYSAAGTANPDYLSCISSSRCRRPHQGMWAVNHGWTTWRWWMRSWSEWWQPSSATIDWRKRLGCSWLSLTGSGLGHADATLGCPPFRCMLPIGGLMGFWPRALLLRVNTRISSANWNRISAL